jgi:hypothetical protein
MSWRKSSFSPTSECVECDASWSKSSFSTANGACVEYKGGWVKSQRSNATGSCVEASYPGDVLVRDSKDQDGPRVRIPVTSWDGGRGLEFIPVAVSEVPAALQLVRTSRKTPSPQLANWQDQPPHPDDKWYAVTDGTNTLYFDQEERDAFLAGVNASEFTLA